MSKLSYEDKINLYNDKKTGISIRSVSTKYYITMNGVNDLVSLINKPGFEILRTYKIEILRLMKKKGQ